MSRKVKKEKNKKPKTRKAKSSKKVKEKSAKKKSDGKKTGTAKKRAVKRKTASKKPTKKSLGKKIKVKIADKESKETIYGSVISETGSEGRLERNSVMQEKKEADYFFDYNFDFNEEEKMQPEFDDKDNAFYKNKEADNFTERQKHIIMYISMAVIMIVIVCFWISGIKNSMGYNFNDSNKENIFLKPELEQSLQDFKEDVYSFETTIKEKSQEALESKEEVKEMIEKEQFKDEITNKLKDKLDNLEEENNLIESENLNINQ